jgi:putative hydrolase of the HAD superfamily
MAIQAVFFDAGGTLIRPFPSVGEVYGGVAVALGYRASPSAVEATFHAVWRDYHGRARDEGLPLPTSDADDRDMWTRITRAIYDSLPAFRGMDFDRWFDGIHEAFTGGDCWAVYPEAAGVIDACRRRGLRCAVVSNWGSYLNDILRKHRLDAPMDFVQVSALEGCLKPDPVFFERALAKARVRPHEALHVGDTYRDDAAGAAAAGLLGIHLDRSGRNGAAPGIPVVRDLRGILDHLST